MVKTLFDEAREEGTLQGTRRTVLSLLEEKFPPLSPAARKKLERMTLDELDRLARQLLRAESLGELGLE